MNTKFDLIKRRFVFPVLVIALAACLAAQGWAEKISPDKVRVSTPRYTPDLSHFNPLLGRHTYSVSWLGIEAGTVELNLTRNGVDYEISANARTAEVIDYLYKLRYRQNAVISALTLRPKQSFSISQENSREKKIKIEFLANGEINSFYADKSGNHESFHFHPDNFTLEPYSAAFMALSMKWDVGDKRQFDTFNGRARYLIELTAVDRTQIMVNGASRDAIVISPRVTKLTDTDPGKLREAKIYISADDSREILKISSDLFIGSVEVDMVAYTPDDAVKDTTHEIY